MDLTQFLIASLAVYRICHLIFWEDGPWDVIVKIRKKAGDGLFGKLMECPFCLSIWISFPIAFVFSKSIGEFLLNWLALSGAAMVIEKIT
jgi:hypothetical protein